MAFADYWNELAGGAIPKLPPGMAQKAVNRAWKDIRNHRLWSFKMVETSFVSPNPVNAGTVSTVFGFNQIVFNAAATAAIATSGFFPPLTQRQIQLSTYEPYNIIAYDTSTNAPFGTATLDRPYAGPTVALQTYNIFRCYFTPTQAGLQRWWTIKDITNGYFMRLNWSRQELDRRDPQRQATGNAFRVVNYKIDPVTGYPAYEFWPWPLNPIVYNAVGIYDPGDFTSPTATLPSQISEQTLMQRAYYYGYQWAEAAKGRFPELRSTSWPFLMSQANANWKESLKDDARLDEELFQQTFIDPIDDDFGFPVDSAYMQSHDVG